MEGYEVDIIHCSYSKFIKFLYISIIPVCHLRHSGFARYEPVVISLSLVGSFMHAGLTSLHAPDSTTSPLQHYRFKVLQEPNPYWVANRKLDPACSYSSANSL